ncbi:MAG: tetratricopeptide repeat protein, partial [Planctomycetota bacterium]
MARILDFTGDERALDYYAKASELKNGDSRALLYAGDFARLRLGSARRASTYYTECSEISKTHPLSIVAAGHLALMDNNPRRAMSHARSAKKADKNLWEPWFLSGSIRAIEILPNGEQNTEFNPRLAAKHFAEAEKRSLSEGAIPRARGVALLAAGKLDEAITDLERAVRIYPKWLDPQIDLSEAYLSRGRFHDAAKLMLPYMIIQHENSDVAFILGAIKFQEGEYSKAYNLLNRARKLDDDHLRAKNWLTKTLIRMNDFEGAAKNAKFTVKEHPASAYAHSMYAVALTKVDKYEDALAQVNMALRLRPGWPVALTVKALTTSTNSMRLCQTAIETEGQWASPHALLGQQYLNKAIYDRTNATFKKAETHLLKALSINSTLVNTRFLLA